MVDLGTEKVFGFSINFGWLMMEDMSGGAARGVWKNWSRMLALVTIGLAGSFRVVWPM